MEQKIAVIDLGTNTFHLLIAEYIRDKYKIIYRDRSAVKIGVGGINRDILPEDGVLRAIKALEVFKLTIDQHGIRNVFAFGTSAFRNAQNSQDVIDRIKLATDIQIKIISGDEEAMFIYFGIRSAMDLGNQPSLIIDIGGGSVEFIIGNSEKVFWKKSVEIGGQRLLEKFQKHDPIAPHEIIELNDYFTLQLPELLKELEKHQVKTMVGSSGTFDTLSEIHCLRNSIAIHEEYPETSLTVESFYSIYNELIVKNRAERLQIPGMIDMRVDMIVVACCLVRYLLENHSFNNIRVSTYSLKEGALAHLIGEKSEGL